MSVSVSAAIGPKTNEHTEYLTKKFQQDGGTFVLNQPATLTVKKGSQYRKLASIGDEKFVAHGAYLGAKGNTIIVFRPHVETRVSYDYMEMKSDDAIKALTGFTDYINELIYERENEDMGEARREADRRESEAYSEAMKVRMQDDERFGSW